MGVSQALAELRQQEVREELSRLLESAAFRSSKRCREFLRHIVEKTVDGEAGSLKERMLGIELFGLPHDYDTSQHTIVRVTASETRKKLAQYYQSGDGANQLVRIELPTGSYNAEFSWKEPGAVDARVVETIPPTSPDPPRTGLTDAPAHRRRISRRWLVAGGATAGGVLLSGLAYRQWVSAKTGAGEPKRGLPLVTNLPAAADPSSGIVRIAAGATAAYLDRNGQTWGIDRYFTGGMIRSRPSERIARTLDPDIYRKVRLGEFRYDIPLAPGSYELHLHFAETGLSDFISAESSGEGQRVFRILANDRPLLESFDVVADAAGANISDERVFRNVSPSADGYLRLAFSPQRGSAMVSGIELIPAPEGRVKPLRIRSGWPTPWRDAGDRQWRADSYFLGGNALVRRTNPARESEPSAPDNAVYASERWGHFSYALPVAEGRYKVSLRFCEGHLGPRNTGVGGVGGRIFDVHCNGVTLIKDLDIVKEAGGEGRPLDRVFTGLRPNAQGKILLTFVPTVGMACVNAIEVVEA